MPSDLFFGTSGPRNARVIIVGEAWGREEAAVHKPFVGQSGRELFRMLGEALGAERALLNEALSARNTHQWLALRERWLERTGILLANTIAAQPPGNDFTHFLVDNKTAKAEKVKDYHGIYPRPELSRGISTLWQLISTVNPSILVAAGNWPLHVLTSCSEPKTTRGFKLPTGIASWRGSQTYTREERVGAETTGDRPQALDKPSHKVIPVLPIIHPAAILREWGYRHVTVHDLRARLGRFLNGQLAWSPPSYNDISRPSFAQVQSQLSYWRLLLGGGHSTVAQC